VSIGERYLTTLRRVEEASSRAGRDAAAVRLIAVGKTFPLECIREAFSAGARDFGENRVQEGFAKAQDLNEADWHLIGPLQKNKVRKALAAFSVIHTLDRADLAQRMNALMERDWPGKRKQVLVEVNIGQERQKAGVLPADAASLVTSAVACDHLDVIGLMAIPPYCPDPEEGRRYFRGLCELRNRLEQDLGLGLPQLSMGMSHDYEVAIAEGATMVRVGTAIFGRRAARK